MLSTSSHRLHDLPQWTRLSTAFDIHAGGATAFKSVVRAASIMFVVDTISSDRSLHLRDGACAVFLSTTVARRNVAHKSNADFNESGLNLSPSQRTVVQNLAGALHTDEGGCMLAVGREVKL